MGVGAGAEQAKPKQCARLMAGGGALMARRTFSRRGIMTDDDVLAEFRAAGAPPDGHFILCSSLRSPRYLQCARVLMDGTRPERLARAPAARLSPAVRRAVQAAVDLGVPYMALIRIDMPTYADNDLPEAPAATPAVKPGSRAAV